MSPYRVRMRLSVSQRDVGLGIWITGEEAEILLRTAMIATSGTLAAARERQNWAVTTCTIAICVICAIGKVSSIEDNLTWIKAFDSTVFRMIVARRNCEASYKPFAITELNTAIGAMWKIRERSQHTDIEMATAEGGKRTSSARVYRRLSMGKCAGCLVDNVSLAG